MTKLEWATLADEENDRLNKRAQLVLAVDAILNSETMRGWVRPDEIGVLGHVRAVWGGPNVDAYIRGVAHDVQ